MSYYYSEKNSKTHTILEVGSEIRVAPRQEKVLVTWLAGVGTQTQELPRSMRTATGLQRFSAEYREFPILFTSSTDSLACGPEDRVVMSEMTLRYFPGRRCWYGSVRCWDFIRIPTTTVGMWLFSACSHAHPTFGGHQSVASFVRRRWGRSEGPRVCVRRAVVGKKRGDGLVFFNNITVAGVSRLCVSRRGGATVGTLRLKLVYLLTNNNSFSTRTRDRGLRRRKDVTVFTWWIGSPNL